MPVEIKEMIVRAVVDPAGGGSTGLDSLDGGGSSNDQIVADCVKQVLKVLKNKKER